MKYILITLLFASCGVTPTTDNEELLKKNKMYRDLAETYNARYLRTGEKKYKEMSDRYADSCNYYNDLLKEK